MIRYAVYTEAYSSRPQLENEETGFTTVFPIPEKIIQMNNWLLQNSGYKK